MAAESRINGGNMDIRRKSMVNTAHYSQGNSSAVHNTLVQHENNNESSNKKNAQNSGKNITGVISEVLGNILSGDLDSDRLLIIALMFVLIKEGADKTLILALGYILL